MPTYRYRCTCGWKVEKFYKSLPSEAKQTSAECEECGSAAPRSFGDEGFYANGGQHSGMEKAVAFSMQKDASGRPIYQDENGKVQEIRSSADIDAWTRHNAVGLPRMTSVKNPITGRMMQIEQRQHTVLDPVTGEVDEAKSGAIIRGPEKLTPLDGYGEFTPPKESITGLPIVDGAMRARKARPLGIIDPETLKPMTSDDVWSDRGEGKIQARADVVKRPPPGKKWA